VVGLKIKPINAGSLPKCVTLEKTAKLGNPVFEIVPMRLADLKPIHELIKFNLGTLEST
jgi:hypothetical protein